MNSRAARIVLAVAGGFAILLGAIWIGQGSGLLPGSFMTGDRTWFVIGLVVAFVGVVLIVIARRRRGSTGSD
jgi:hypothetical protein